MPLNRPRGPQRSTSWWSIVGRDIRGASFVEYIIVVGVVALLAIAAWRQFNGAVTAALDREAYHVRTLEPGASQDLPGSGDNPVSGAVASSPPPEPTTGGVALDWPSRIAAVDPSPESEEDERARAGGGASKASSAVRAAAFVAGVLKIMCPQDKAFLQDLRARGVTITAYDRIYFDDPYFDGKKWTTKRFNAGGTTDVTDINIILSSNPAQNAGTIYHEGVHTGQPHMEWRDKEYEAYAKSEEWAMSHGLPPHDPTFRSRDPSGKEVVDIAAVHKYVDAHYPGVSSKASSGAPLEQVVGKAPNGNTVVQRGDGTRYERPPRAGDSFASKDEVTVPAGGISIDMNKLQCP